MNGRQFPAAVRITLLYACMGAVSILLFYSLLPALFRNQNILTWIDASRSWIT